MNQLRPLAYSRYPAIVKLLINKNFQYTAPNCTHGSFTSHPASALHPLMVLPQAPANHHDSTRRCRVFSIIKKREHVNVSLNKKVLQESFIRKPGGFHLAFSGTPVKWHPHQVNELPVKINQGKTRPLIIVLGITNRAGVNQIPLTLLD